MAKTPEIDLRDSLVGQNLIINGGFDFWQRGISFSSSGTQGSYTVDRWKSSTNGSVARTISRSTDVPASSNSLYSFQYAVTTGASLSAAQWEDLTYTIEGNDLRKIKGQTFTISFWVKASFSGVLTLAVRNYANNRSYVTTYNVDSPNTWEYKTITLTHDTTGTWNYDNQGGMTIYFTMGTGSNYQTSSLNQWIAGNFGGTSTMYPINATTGNTVKIADLMLNKGTEALPFSLAGGNYAGELQLCQRYCETLVDGQIGQIAEATDIANRGSGEWIFRVVKRSTPVVSFSGTIVVYNHNTGANIASTANAYTSQQTTKVRLLVSTASGISQGQYTKLGYSTSVLVIAEAEL